MSKDKFDFGGYATKNDLKCTDGRTILKDAFKDNDGGTVPLVWQHQHNEPANVLGHALLENREDGVYAYCVFNDSKAGKEAKTLVQHRDITSLSIYANGLIEKSKQVMHGVIREVSLVLAGANPGAVIDNLVMQHADGSLVTDEEEAIIYSGLDLEHSEKEAVKEEPPKEEPVEETPKEEVSHADDTASDEETVGDIFNTLTEKQKNVVYHMIASVANKPEEKKDDEVNHSNEDKGDKGTMKHNVFEGQNEENNKPEAVLTHAQFASIMDDAKKCGSFKTAFLAHIQTYGIENIDYLFPDAKTLTNQPSFIKRDTGWVANVINGTYHTPFSRIKTVHADITADAARAMGYAKGNLKKDEIINLLRRTTTPITIYKKQKLDRDDIVDITDIDVVAWLKQEMRLMLDEELARAILVGDGREAGSEDKIKEANIRPIWKDDDMYAHHVVITATPNGLEPPVVDANDIIDGVARARANYKGSGEPSFYTTSTVLSDMLLLKDTLGRRIYATQGELEAALRVKAIVEVPVTRNRRPCSCYPGSCWHCCQPERLRPGC
jgi:hypothetical protein